MSISEDTPIQYRFLSMDQRRFMPEQELAQQFKAGGQTRAIHEFKGKVLIAYGHNPFAEESATTLARELGFDVQRADQPT